MQNFEGALKFFANNSMDLVPIFDPAKHLIYIKQTEIQYMQSLFFIFTVDYFIQLFLFFLNISLLSYSKVQQITLLENFDISDVRSTLE